MTILHPLTTPLPMPTVVYLSGTLPDVHRHHTLFDDIERELLRARAEGRHDALRATLALLVAHLEAHQPPPGRILVVRAGEEVVDLGTAPVPTTHRLIVHVVPPPWIARLFRSSTLPACVTAAASMRLV